MYSVLFIKDEKEIIMKKVNDKGFSHGLLLPVLIVFAFIAAVSYYVYSHNNGKAVNNQEDQSPVTLKEELPNDLLTATEVKKLASSQKPNSTIVKIGLEKQNGVLLYVVKLSDGTHLFYNAQTGLQASGIVENETEDSNDKLPADISGIIDFLKAQTIAMAQKPGATVQSIEFELEDGAIVYNVRFTDKSRIIINAKSGKVIAIKHPEQGGKKTEESNSKDDSTDTKSSDTNSGDSHRSGNSSDDSTSNDSGGDNSGSGSHDSNDD